MENSEIEKILKEKMNSLSNSVDCFNKISARAFPEKDPVFFESEYTVSDVENVTGKPNYGRIVRWTALAAAVVLGIVFIPKSGIIQRKLSTLENSPKRFQALLSEINEETKQHNYQELDVPLDYYIKNDVLVTPLFSCPFESIDNKDAMVRIFIRETGEGQFTDYDTAQVYAVEYVGDYSTENIVAAANSIYDFTDDDLVNAEIKGNSPDLINAAVTLNFTPDSENEYMQDIEGEEISAASLSNSCFILYEGRPMMASTYVLYGHKGTGFSTEYFYDIITTSGDEVIELPDRQAMWEKSLYYNGTSSFPRTTKSNFTRTELFPSVSYSNDSENSFGYIGDFNSFSVDMDRLRKCSELKLSSSITKSTINTIATPSDPDLLYGLRLYYAYEHLDGYNEHENPQGATLTVYCDEAMLTNVPLDQFAYNRRKTNEELEKLHEEISANVAATLDEYKNNKASENSQTYEIENTKLNLNVLVTEYETKNKELTEKLHSDLNGWEKQNISDEIEANEDLIRFIKAKLEELESSK